MRASIFLAAPLVAAVYATSPAVTTTASLITSQPPVATIPAGLPKGETVVYYNASGTLESFSVSVGKSTTIVLSGNSVTASGSAATGGPKQTGSSTTSGNAAPTSFKAASAGILGLGAFVAALL